MSHYFSFKGNDYGKGTIVQIYQQYVEGFKFYSNLVFVEYDSVHNLYYFQSLYSCWDKFAIAADQLEAYVEKITEPHGIVMYNNSGSPIQQDHVEGIVDAWLWYVIIMFFGLFLKGPISTIGIWILASIVFFTWRHKKMNGE